MDHKKILVFAAVAFFAILCGYAFYKSFISAKEYTQTCALLDGNKGIQLCQKNIFSTKCFECRPLQCSFLGEKRGCMLADGKTGVQICIERGSIGRAWDDCILHECDYIGQEKECALEESAKGEMVCNSFLVIGTKWSDCKKSD